MKTILSVSPVFTPAAKTLDFSSVEGFDVKRLYAVINLTQNAVIYAVGQTANGLDSFASGVVTLVFDTTAHSSGDLLMSIYEDASAVQQTQDESLNALADSIQYLTNVIAKNMPRVDQNNRQATLIESISGGLTLANVTTVATVTTANTLGTMQNMAGGNTAQIPYNQIPIHLYDKVAVS